LFFFAHRAVLFVFGFGFVFLFFFCRFFFCRFFSSFVVVYFGRIPRIPGAYGQALPVTAPEPNPLPAQLTVVDGSDPAAVRAALLACDVAVYAPLGSGDATGATEDAARTLHADAEAGGGGTGRRRVFVCVSTVLTWARTRGPGGGDDDGDGEGDDDENAPGGDFVLTEDDVRRRRAHPAFRHYLTTEKTVSRLRVKGRLRTVVIAAGLMYGRGEWMLHPWFKDAWSLRPPSLDCYGRGDNVVPTVHVEDLAGVIVAAAAPECTARYLLAVDDAQSTLAEICAAINRELGTGRPIGRLREDQVLLLRDVDLLLVNLRLEAAAARDLGYEWKYAAGLVEGIGAAVADFRRLRGLTSVRVAVHGPPASGKSHYAALIARHYHIHHIRFEEVVAEWLAQADEDAREEIREAAQAYVKGEVGVGGWLGDDWGFCSDFSYKKKLTHTHTHTHTHALAHTRTAREPATPTPTPSSAGACPTSGSCGCCAASCGSAGA
jgi:Na+-transporting methylmalonyl-CoA/oxaloacetate decarboxylase gamma subunit